MQKRHILYFFNIFSSLAFILFLTHFTAQTTFATLCDTYGTSCVPIRFCANNCNVCTDTDNNGNSLGCPGGQTCCDPNLPPANTPTPVPQPTSPPQCTGTAIIQVNNPVCPTDGSCVSANQCTCNNNYTTSTAACRWITQGSSTVCGAYNDFTCSVLCSGDLGGGQSRTISTNGCSQSGGNGNPPPPPPDCSTGPVYGKCNANKPNTCNNNNGTQKVTLTRDGNGGTNCNLTSYNQACTTNACNNTFTCNGGNCITTMSGYVWVDTNGDGIKDNGEGNYTGSALQINYSWSTGSNHTFTTNNGASNGTPDGTYSINAEQNTYTVSLNAVPAHFILSTPQSYTINLTAATTRNFGLIPVYDMTGNVFIDYNYSGAQDPGESNATTQTTNMTEQLSWSTGSRGSKPIGNGGSFAEDNVEQNTYTFTFGTIPTGYTLTAIKSGTTTSTTNAISVLVNADSTMTVGIAPTYSISGTVFNDKHDVAGSTNGTYNPPPAGFDTPRPGVVVTVCSTINCSTAFGNIVHKMTTDGSGHYGDLPADQILTPGTYYVSIAVPTGFETTTLTTYTVKVGVPVTQTTTTCQPAGPQASCKTEADNGMGGSIQNLNFGVTNQIAWFQGICSDLRIDQGVVDTLPNTGTCDGVHSNQYANISGLLCTNPGIVFSGNTTADFGPNGGQASAQNWIVGGSSAPELFSPADPGVIRDSYEYIQTTARINNVPIVDLSAYCDVSNCTAAELANLPSGVYSVTGDFTLVGPYTAPANVHYAFLINGNMTIVNSDPNTPGAVLIPDGSTAIFATTGNILIDPTVGEPTPTSYDATIEGWYVSDHSIIIENYTGVSACQSTGQPNNKRLNVVGVLIPNASLNGGTIQNLRDMCIYDTQCPAYSVSGDIGNVSGNRSGAGSGLGYLLNTPAFLKHQNFAWQEQIPGN